MDNPRGRIALMRAASDGRIGLDGAFREHMERCLACRACEPACPSGVHYGELIQSARVAAERVKATGTFEHAAQKIALETLAYPRRLRFVAWWMRLYQALGLQPVMRRLLRGKLREMHALLPRLPARYPDYSQPFHAIGTRRGTVALHTGCVQDAFLADVNAATIRVLQHNGIDVIFPTVATCCGAAQLHSGEEALARELARKNIDAFEPLFGKIDAIISNAGGCGATLKEYGQLLQDDPAYASRSAQFSSRVKDITEYLAEHLNVAPQGQVKARVTNVDSCHLRNAQRVIRQPRELLGTIPGVELAELAHPDYCCGSAGVYNIMHSEIANALLDSKMQDISATGADTIVVTNTGCHLQLLKGVRNKGYNARVLHLVQLLDESYTRGIA
jgi:glycolate oxidase iron-sulfur subunit